MLRPLQRPLSFLCLLFGLSSFSLSTLAASTPKLQQLEITYLYQGLPFPVYLNWQVEQNQYQLSLKVAALGRSREISSSGTLSESYIQPKHYLDLKDAEVENEAHFDWVTQQVQLSKKNENTALSLGDQDILSAIFQFALHPPTHSPQRLGLVNGNQLYSDTAFTQLETPLIALGRHHIHTVRWQAQTDTHRIAFWLAPQWSNVPVGLKLNIGNREFEFWASAIKINGVEVL